MSGTGHVGIGSASRLPAVLLSLLLLGGCVTPAFSRSGYADDASAALDSATSAVATAQLALTARMAGNATRAFADTVVTDGERAMGPIETSFGGVDPPSPADDPLRDSVMQVLGVAGDSLSEARIAVRRDDPSQLQQASVDLAAARGRLDALRGTLP